MKTNFDTVFAPCYQGSAGMSHSVPLFLQPRFFRVYALPRYGALAVSLFRLCANGSSCLLYLLTFLPRAPSLPFPPLSLQYGFILSDYHPDPYRNRRPYDHFVTFSSSQTSSATRSWRWNRIESVHEHFVQSVDQWYQYPRHSWYHGGVR